MVGVWVRVRVRVPFVDLMHLARAREVPPRSSPDNRRCSDDGVPCRYIIEIHVCAVRIPSVVWPNIFCTIAYAVKAEDGI